MDRERRREEANRDNLRGRGKDLKRGRQGWRERDQAPGQVINSAIALTCGAL
jgi:FtsZ-binding cell division protein ZapB